MSNANVSLQQGGTASASYGGATLDSQGNASAYGVTIDAEGNLNVDGLVASAIDALDSHAPQALKDIANGLVSAATTYGATVEGASGAAAFFAADAATTAAVLSAATVVGVVIAVAVLLLTIDPASAGPGCCGTDTSKRYGTCSPSLFDWYGPNGPGSVGNEGGQWAGDHWTDPGAQQQWKPSNAWEAAIGAFIQGKFKALSGCWIYLSPQWYVATLAAAIAAWNATHSSSSTTKVTRMVNWFMPGGTFGGAPQAAVPYQPQSWADPIAIALNNASLNYGKDASGNVVVTGAKVRPFAFASFTVNTGPVVSPLAGIGPIKMEPQPQQPQQPQLPIGPVHLTPIGHLPFPPTTTPAPSSSRPAPRKLVVDFWLLGAFFGFVLAGPTGAAVASLVVGTLGYFVSDPEPPR